MKYFMRLAPLFMVILIDVMGIVLVLPVLTILILAPNSSMIPSGMPLLWRDFFYGLSIALYPLFMFFSTPILGDLSDKFGRKKILLLCLLGGSISYLISVVAIAYNSLFIFLASRAIAGLAAGTQAIARAAIIDLSSKANKTKNLAWIVFVSSIGIILGPLLGGLTSEKNLASWLSFEMPFYMAALLSLICLILLMLTYKDQKILKKQDTVNLFKGFSLFLRAFLNANFRLISASYFCFTLAWSLYFQTMNWLLLEKFHYTSGQLGFFMAYIGVIYAIASILVVRIVMRFFRQESAALNVILLLMSVGMFAAALSHTETAQWSWVVLIACCDVLCYTLSLSIFSSLADEESQGWVMGSMGAVDSLTWAVGGLIAGPLGYLSLRVPLWTAGGLCLAGYWLMLLFRRQHN